MNQLHHQPSFRVADGIADATGDFSYSRTVFGLVLGLYLTYRLLLFYDLPLLSIPEVFWNCFVYLMPSRLVFALGKSGGSTGFHQSSDQATNCSTQHAHKSDVLRNVFRLDKATRLGRKCKPGHPPGLGNWDNSCYQNSVIQAFASIQSLEAFLTGNTNIRSLPKDTTAYGLSELIRKLNSDDGGYLWTPPKLKSMSSWQQQDAQEYFSKVIEAIEKDILLMNRSELMENFQAGFSNTFAKLSPGDVNQRSNLAPLGDEAVEDYLHGLIGSNKSSKVSKCLQNPLEGLLAQRVGCTRCGYVEGLSLIPFNCITLPLGRAWQYDVEDCLNEFTSLESIEGVECAKCTLLKAKVQLRQISETLATSNGEEVKSEVSDASHNWTHGKQQEIESRLEAVSDALKEDDYTEASLAKKCQIPSRFRTTSTKSRQAIIMRSPKTLVLHLNRSLFDENTGIQSKNYADVRYPKILDIAPWCIGSRFRVGLGEESSITEEWEMSPLRSMTRDNNIFVRESLSYYELRAVITHYGRHENGHYVCYRRVPRTTSILPDEQILEPSSKNPVREDVEGWWRFSDEEVSQVDEDDVLSQGGAFMLFYELVEGRTEARALSTSTESAERVVLHPNHDAGLVAVIPGSSKVDAKPQEDVNGLQKGLSDVSVPKPIDFHANGYGETHGSEKLLVESSETNDESTILDVISDKQPTDDSQTLFNHHSSSHGTKQIDLPAMRTAGPEAHRRSEDASPFRSLHMVASM